jgi:hypothetical protein
MGVGEKIKSSDVKSEAKDEPIKNLVGENRTSRKAPTKVPSILPKK